MFYLLASSYEILKLSFLCELVYLNIPATFGIERRNEKLGLSSFHVPNNHSTDTSETVQLLLHLFLPAWHFPWSCFTLAEVAHEESCICSAHILIPQRRNAAAPAVLVPDDSVGSLVYKQGEWLGRKQTEVRAHGCRAAVLPPPCDRAALLPGAGSCHALPASWDTASSLLGLCHVALWAPAVVV